mmetsp:Transcript_47316/g.90323  ORF Transcript_47316/g.90323 Transcript_47316/m.90323 type:complete len:237 (-) Transcript_47316:412-1122(-)
MTWTMRTGIKTVRACRKTARPPLEAVGRSAPAPGGRSRTRAAPLQPTRPHPSSAQTAQMVQGLCHPRRALPRLLWPMRKPLTTSSPPCTTRATATSSRRCLICPSTLTTTTRLRMTTPREIRTRTWRSGERRGWRELGECRWETRCTSGTGRWVRRTPRKQSSPPRIRRHPQGRRKSQARRRAPGANAREVCLHSCRLSLRCDTRARVSRQICARTSSWRARHHARRLGCSSSCCC